MVRNKADKVIPIVLNKGIDAGSDPKISPGFTKLENVSITRSGTFSRRNPTKQMDTTNNLYLSEYDNKPILIGSEGYEVWDKASLTDAAGDFYTVPSIDDWGDDNTFPEKFWDIGYKPFTGSDGAKLVSTEHIYHDKYLFVGYVYVDPEDDAIITKFRAYNRYSGQLYATSSSTEYPNAEFYNVRFLVMNDRPFAFFSDSNGDVAYSEYDTGNEAWLSNGVVKTDLGVSPTAMSLLQRNIDATMFGTSTDNGFICYTDSYDDPTYFSLAAAGAIGSALTGSAGTIAVTASNTVCCNFKTAYAAMAYNDSGDIHVRVFDTSLVEQITTAALTVSGVPYGMSSGTKTDLNSGNETISIVYYGGSDKTVGEMFFYEPSAGTGGTVGISDKGAGAREANHIYPYSKPFWINDGRYVWLSDVGLSNIDYGDRTLIMWDLANYKPVAKTLVGTSGAMKNATYWSIGLVSVTVSGNSFSMCAPKTIDENATSVNLVTGSLIKPQVVQTPNSTCLISSIVYEQNNQEFIEQGWLTYPKLPSVTPTGSGSAINLGAGVYSYVIVLERRTANGSIVRSTPSSVVSVDVADTHDSVTLDFTYWPACNMTFGRHYSSFPSQEDWNYIFYRTLKDGSIFYRLPTPGAHSDNLPDSSISSNETLYTTGGILANTPPPSSRCGIVYQNRLFLVDRENESTRIYYSKPFTPGVGIENSNSLFLTVSFAGGRIYALGTMDDKLIIFKKNSIYATYGKGLNNVGSGQNYAEPILISNAVGCINRDSVVLIPEGLMFESDNGIRLLNRSMDVTYIGEPVKYWYENMTISDALHNKTKNEVIFMDSSSNATALVYNYKYKIWTTHTNMKSDSARIIDDKLIYVADGKVRVEDSSLTQDDDTPMSMTIETSWMSFGEIAGYQRVRNLLILGQNIADSTITVKAQYDYTPVWEDTQQFATSRLENFSYAEHFGAGLSAGTYADQSMLLKVVLSQQKCSSCRFQIVITSTGLGVDLTALAFVINRKPGQARLEGNRRL